MATVRHSQIPDAFRHEPKGISTAPTGTVYVSDGDGTGTWKDVELEGQSAASSGMIPKSNGDGSVTWKYNPSGWATYKQDGSPQVFNSTPSRLTIDGTSSASDSSYLPYEIRGTGELWDTVNNKITPITLGDAYDVRINFIVTAETASPTEIVTSLDIGTGSSITNEVASYYIPTGRTLPYKVTIPIPIYCLSTFIANGGQIFISSDTGSITVEDKHITIFRTSAGDF